MVSSLTFSTTRPLTRLRSTFSVIRPAMRSRMSLRASASPGSGSRVAISAARAAARGRRAGQMCKVEICPCRTFFSCTESSETCFRGKATSIRRLGLGEVIVWHRPCAWKSISPA